MEETIVALDIGTTKICTLVGEVDEGGTLRILGAATAPSRGLKKGMVVNVEEATSAIGQSVTRAEEVSGYEIHRVYVGVAGNHISSVNSKGVAAISRGIKGVTPDDVERAMQAAQAIAMPQNREIIHAVPRGYTIDGQDGIKNPLGLQGFRLEVEAHLVTGAVTPLQNLVKCVQGAGLEVIELVLEPLACGEAALNPQEKEMGVAVVDIGGGTTDMAIFIDGSAWHTMVLPVGGNHLTNDIAVGLRTPFPVAEEIKIRHGHTLSESIGGDEVIDVATFGAVPSGRRTVFRKRLAQIIEARVEEVFELVLKEIKRSGYDGLLPAGVVLCGGTSLLPGLSDFASRALDMPTRIGTPDGVEGIGEEIAGPGYATSVGLLLWGYRKMRDQTFPVLRPRGFSRKFRDWFQALLPG